MAAAGLMPRLVAGWYRPGRTVRSLRGMSDGGLLALLMGTMAVYLLAQWPAHVRAAQLDASVPLGARLGGALLATMFLMPLLVYALAALSGMVARALRWPVTPADARLALIWALTLVAPLMLLGGMTQGLIGVGPALTLVQVATGVAFVAFWAANLRALGQKGGTR